MIEVTLGKMPVWRYFGATLKSAPGARQWAVTDVRAPLPASIDRLEGVPLFPGEANGQKFSPALSMHRGGLDWVHECILTQWDDSTEGTIRLVLSDALVGISVILVLSLAPESDVLRMRTQLKNHGNAPLELQSMAVATIGLPSAAREIGYFTGQWAQEFQWRRHAIAPTGWERVSRAGRTSHDAVPAWCMLTPETAQFVGQAWCAHLAWSGNHRVSVLPTDGGSFCLQAGEYLAPGEAFLAPGDSIETPELLISYSSNGLDGASVALHEHLQSAVLKWPGGRMRPRPVHLNTWEAVYFRHDLVELTDLAGKASSLGIERFVLDDGWFQGRNDDLAALGDWWPDPTKYPAGLAPLIDHVRGLGMEFGLWVEPEMVNPDSQLFRNHPDWALQISGREFVTGRNQLVLDVFRPEVADYLFSKLDVLLRDNAISYLKWDMNRDLAQAGGADGRASYRRQVHSLYALLDKIRAAHPTVEIESCAAGGARTDYGILRHTHRLWLSDNNDALSRLTIQSGAFRLFPPEIAGSHVGPAPAHTTGRSQSLEFRGAISLFGHFGIEADIRYLSDGDCQILAGWISLYKSLRDTLHHGRFHQGNSATGLTWWMAIDDHRAVLGVFRGTQPDSANEPELLLPPLTGDALWRVRMERCVGKIRAHASIDAPLFDAYREGGAIFSGHELAQLGLPLPTMNAESALIFVLDRLPGNALD